MLLRIATICAAALGLAACGDGGDSSGGKTSSTRPHKPGNRPADVARDGKVLLAAGDIAQCDSNGDEQTARLAEKLPKATIAALGDLAYPRGAPSDFVRCWDPSWGHLGNRVRPAAGNHEYGTGVATTYYDYFGPRAGPRDRGWYSYDLGDWHVVVLNSNCDFIPGGGCAAGSEQERWLRADLASHRGRCTLAYWHHARYSSGVHGDTPAVAPLFRALTDAHADVLLQAHDHHYERFAPRRGLREFVVGTGGAHNYPVGPGEAKSEVRWAGGHGLLALTLRPAGYEWRYLPAGGSSFEDSGSGRCA